MRQLSNNQKRNPEFNMKSRDHTEILDNLNEKTEKTNIVTNKITDLEKHQFENQRVKVVKQKPVEDNEDKPKIKFIWTVMPEEVRKCKEEINSATKSNENKTREPKTPLNLFQNSNNLPRPSSQIIFNPTINTNFLKLSQPNLNDNQNNNQNNTESIQNNSNTFNTPKVINIQNETTNNQMIMSNQNNSKQKDKENTKPIDIVLTPTPIKNKELIQSDLKSNAHSSNINTNIVMRIDHNSKTLPNDKPNVEPTIEPTVEPGVEPTSRYAPQTCTNQENHIIFNSDLSVYNPNPVPVITNQISNDLILSNNINNDSNRNNNESNNNINISTESVENNDKLIHLSSRKTQTPSPEIRGGNIDELVPTLTPTPIPKSNNKNLSEEIGIIECQNNEIPNIFSANKSELINVNDNDKPKTPSKINELNSQNSSFVVKTNSLIKSKSKTLKIITPHNSFISNKEQTSEQIAIEDNIKMSLEKVLYSLVCSFKRILVCWSPISLTVSMPLSTSSFLL